MAVDINLSDFRKLSRTVDKIGQLPKKCVTKAARKGGNLVMKAVRQKAPVDTGSLKKGLRLKGEKNRAKGKKVYDIVFDAGMNSVFQKPIQNPGEAGGQSKTAYYPASMEYGYFARNGRYIPGYRFMRGAAEEAEAAAASAMVNTLSGELDREWEKQSAGSKDEG